MTGSFLFLRRSVGIRSSGRFNPLGESRLDAFTQPGQTDDQVTEQVWAEEAERRYRELKSGDVEPIPSDEVFRGVRARLR